MSEKSTPHEFPRMVKAMDDAEIESAAAADPDTFMPDAKWFENARLVMPTAKETVILRLDSEVVA